MYSNNSSVNLILNKTFTMNSTISKRTGDEIQPVAKRGRLRFHGIV